MAGLSGHTDKVTVLAYHQDVLYSGSWDETIRSWDLQTNRALTVFVGHTGSIYALCLDEDTLYSGSFDCTVRSWNPQSGAPKHTFDFGQPVWSLCLGDLLGGIFIGLGGGEIRTLSSGSSGPLRPGFGAAGHTDDVESLAVCLPHNLSLRYRTLERANGQLVSASADNTVRVWCKSP